MQRLLNTAEWDAEAVRDDLREYVVEHLGDDKGGVLIVDETGFLKKGTKSVGVKRQYTGTAGKTENCQIGVFLCYASESGAAFIDRALYLPKEWAKDKGRRAQAGIPEEVEFVTKPAMARQMLERAFDAGVRAGWVTGDTIYGSARRLRMFLEERGVPFVLGVKSDESLWTLEERGPGQLRAEKIAEGVKPEEWRRRVGRSGIEGRRASLRVGTIASFQAAVERAREVLGTLAFGQTERRGPRRGRLLRGFRPQRDDHARGVGPGCGHPLADRILL